MADMAKEHPDCAYCAKGELVKKFGYEICELPASTVYLFKEQSHPGRCIVASKHHVSEMLELSEADRVAYRGCRHGCKCDSCGMPPEQAELRYVRRHGLPSSHAPRSEV